MRIERIPGFIYKIEQKEILEWFTTNAENPDVFGYAYNNFEDGYLNRLSTRRIPNVVYPEVITNIFKRILSTFEFTSICSPETTEYNDGIIAVITKKDGYTFSHKDTETNCKDGNSVIRFNIVIQEPDLGGELWVKDENDVCINIAPKERELHAYNVSDYYHTVSKVKSDKPRYILLFSMCCPREHWDSSLIRINTKRT